MTTQTYSDCIVIRSQFKVSSGKLSFRKSNVSEVGRKEVVFSQNSLIS